MQVTLSKVEVTEIAAEVVRLMKQQGLVSVAPQGVAGAKGKATTSTPTKAPAKPTAQTKQKAQIKPNVAPAPAKSTPAVAAIGNTDTYTIATAAKAKGYHPNTVRRAIKSGKLKAKLSKDGTYQISQAALNTFSI
jgi:hypothetical protein